MSTLSNLHAIFFDSIIKRTSWENWLSLGREFPLFLQFFFLQFFFTFLTKFKIVCCHACSALIADLLKLDSFSKVGQFYDFICHVCHFLVVCLLFWCLFTFLNCLLTCLLFVYFLDICCARTIFTFSCCLFTISCCLFIFWFVYVSAGCSAAVCLLSAVSA
jgi:hypothetical protein